MYTDLGSGAEGISALNVALVLNDAFVHCQAVIPTVMISSLTQVITTTKADLPSKVFCGIPLVFRDCTFKISTSSRG